MDNEINADRKLAHYWLGETCFKLKDDANMERDDVDTQDVHAQDGMEHAHLMEHDAREEHDDPMASPPEPSPEDRAGHELHQAKYAAWCLHRIVGQSKQRPYTKIHVDTHEHIVYADFTYITSKREELQVTDGDPPKEEDGGEVVTVLTAIDKDSRWAFAVAIPSKKVDDPNSYAVKLLETWLVGLGWKQFGLQTDKEPVFLKFAKKCPKKLAMTTCSCERGPGIHLNPLPLAKP